MTATLKPYAASLEYSRGRVQLESPPRYRSEFQRDRIVHYAAFRQLEYKTQVFVNHEGDMFRTRLTQVLCNSANPIYSPSRWLEEVRAYWTNAGSCTKSSAV